MHLLTTVFTVGVTEKLGDVEDSESCSPGKKFNNICPYYLDSKKIVHFSKRVKLMSETYNSFALCNKANEVFA